MRWVMQDLKDDPSVELQVLVSGSHLSPQFGDTWKSLTEDGFDPILKVEMLLDSDSAVGAATSMGLGVMKYADALVSLRPHLVVVLGDRYEVLAMAAAATCMGVPIAHIHGGEATEGAIDDSLRNAVTALAHLHFPTAAEYAGRIRQMGVAPERIFQVGAPALDNLQRLALLDRDLLAVELGMDLNAPLLMVTYHPVSVNHDDPAGGIDVLLQALEHFPDTRILLSGANQDAGGRAINARLEAFAARNPRHIRLVTSLGSRRYLSVLKHAAVVLGNSSSGIIEAPACGTAVVNVGPRQNGRLRAASVIDCAEDAEAVITAIKRAMSDEFQAVAKLGQTPYGQPGGCSVIAQTLATIPLDGLGIKKFHDLPGGIAWMS
ncbi:UDP-N-acetylglucosamine 2-epimerase [Magnetospirillum gryphiswaldense]|uniref:UDP-N-acetylglucosamine 2-epimerase n=1 Tax=Magnetospirillum gryphiswaldense TaxID=55518 RepID=UPI001F238768|nr:UDP-N-acetylglucosamine 2-epimerase [Magnetospirillum gryphiswaldense]